MKGIIKKWSNEVMKVKKIMIIKGEKKMVIEAEIKATKRMDIPLLNI